jgi:hypothetical protein
VQAAEDAWNTRDSEKVNLAYTIDTEWRNRSMGNGIVHMETKCGNLMPMAICKSDMPALMTWRSKKQKESSNR